MKYAIEVRICCRSELREYQRPSNRFNGKRYAHLADGKECLDNQGILPGRPWGSYAVSNGLARLYKTIGRRGLERFREESCQDVLGAAPQCQIDWRGYIGPLGAAP